MRTETYRGFRLRRHADYGWAAYSRTGERAAEARTKRLLKAALEEILSGREHLQH